MPYPPCPKVTKEEKYRSEFDDDIVVIAEMYPTSPRIPPTSTSGGYPLELSQILKLASAVVGFSFILYLATASLEANPNFASSFHHHVDDTHLHFLLPIDKPNTLFCQTLFTTFMNGYKPTLLYFNDSVLAHASTWEKQVYKVSAFQKYITNNVTNPNDLVLMADSMDVWMQLPASELLSRYAHIGSPIVFSAEKNCYPVGEWCKTAMDSPLPHDVYGTLTDTEVKYNRPRWLNSGLLMGKAGHFQTLLDFAKEWQSTAHGTDRNDQAVFNWAYNSGKFNISLDFMSEIFQSAYQSMEDLDRMDVRTGKTIPEFVLNQYLALSRLLSNGFRNSHSGSVWPLYFRSSRFVKETYNTFFLKSSYKFPVYSYYNHVSSKMPVAVHFNGFKNVAKEQWPNTWWMQLGYLRHLYPEEATLLKNKVMSGIAVLPETGEVLSWNDLCADHMSLDLWTV